jgi:PIN domain nuclease of toxin-antitoxin system
MIYLDTHAVVWLYAGETTRFPDKARAAIDMQDLRVSPMVRLELHYLYETERISVRPDEVLARLTADLGLATCDHPFDAVVAKAGSLSWTRDPFDRIITAQAALHKSHLVTKDRTIRAHYRHCLWD